MTTKHNPLITGMMSSVVWCYGGRQYAAVCSCNGGHDIIAISDITDTVVDAPIVAECQPQESGAIVASLHPEYRSRTAAMLRASISCVNAALAGLFVAHMESPSLAVKEIPHLDIRTMAGMKPENNGE